MEYAIAHIDDNKAKKYFSQLSTDGVTSDKYSRVDSIRNVTLVISYKNGVLASTAGVLLPFELDYQALIM